MPWFNPFINGGSGGGSITVDSSISDTSTNPVQNKVISNALDLKLNIGDGVGEYTDGVSMTTGTGIGPSSETISATGAAHSERFGNYQSNVSSGTYSHAEGNTTASTGSNSHAEGSRTLASADSAHSEGSITKASGSASHSEGATTLASGAASHAEGISTQATGTATHAEGSYTVASGTDAHSEGVSTQATGEASHAEGNQTVSSDFATHAEGNATSAEGPASHAEGIGTSAIGRASHAEGYMTSADSDYQHVQGQFNVIDDQDKFAFIIGNGTADDDRSNALAVDWDGKIYVDNDTTGVDIAELADTVANLPQPMVFKGGLGTGGTITTLPAASASNVGFVYKVVEDGTYDSIAAKTGDIFISNGTEWVLVPSGDDGSSGTVSSVAIEGSAGSGLTVSGSPITTSGTIKLTLNLDASPTQSSTKALQSAYIYNYINGLEITTGDLNEKGAGRYKIASPSIAAMISNCPYKGGPSILEVVQSNLDVIIQRLFFEGERFYMRSRINNTWGDWYLYSGAQRSPIPTNFAEIAQIVRAGNAKSVFEIGDIITTTYTATDGTTYDMPWIVVDFRDVTLEDSSVVPAMWLQSKYATLEEIQFDAPEPTRPSAEDYSGRIKSSGWNRYSKSAIRQWLNSDAVAGSWWTAQSEYDATPTQAATINGFMHGLPADFIAMLKPVKVETCRNYRDPDSARSSSTYEYDTTYEVFFPASREQMAYSAIDLDHREGYTFAYWIGATNNSRNKPAINSPTGSSVYYWLRSVRRSDIDTAYRGSDYYHASAAYHCAPVCVIC